MCNPITWGVGTVYISHTHSDNIFESFFPVYSAMKYSRILKFDRATGGFVRVKVPSTEIDEILYLSDYMYSRRCIDDVKNRMELKDPFFKKKLLFN